MSLIQELCEYFSDGTEISIHPDVLVKMVAAIAVSEAAGQAKPDTTQSKNSLISGDSHIICDLAELLGVEERREAVFFDVNRLARSADTDLSEDFNKEVAFAYLLRNQLGVDLDPLDKDFNELVLLEIARLKNHVQFTEVPRQPPEIREVVREVAYNSAAELVNDLAVKLGCHADLTSVFEQIELLQSNTQQIPVQAPANLEKPAFAEKPADSSNERQVKATPIKFYSGEPWKFNFAPDVLVELMRIICEHGDDELSVLKIRLKNETGIEIPQQQFQGICRGWKTKGSSGLSMIDRFVGLSPIERERALAQFREALYRRKGAEAFRRNETLASLNEYRESTAR